MQILIRDKLDYKLQGILEHLFFLFFSRLIYFNQPIISIISVDCVLSLYIKARINGSFWCAFGILCLYYADNVILGTHVEPSCFVFLCATITLWLRYITIDFYYLYRKHLRPMIIV